MLDYKVCSGCKEKKSCFEFYKDNSRKSGLRSNCKKCCEPTIKKRHEKAKLKTKIERQILLDKNGKDCRKCKMFKNFSEFYKSKKGLFGYNRLCKICDNELYKKCRINYRNNHYKYKKKFIIIAHYSMGEMCCRECKYNNIKGLQVDHINGNGAEHRRTFKYSSQLYDWLIKNNFPDGFQILCANCNTVKKIENKENPWSKIVADDV